MTVATKRGYMNSVYIIIFFKPSQRLVYKKVVGSKLKRKFDKTQTPYERVLASKDVLREV